MHYFSIQKSTYKCIFVSFDRIHISTRSLNFSTEFVFTKEQKSYSIDDDNSMLVMYQEWSIANKPVSCEWSSLSVERHFSSKNIFSCSLIFSNMPEFSSSIRPWSVELFKYSHSLSKTILIATMNSFVRHAFSDHRQISCSFRCWRTSRSRSWIF